SSADQQLVELIAGPLLQELGYLEGSPNPNGSAQDAPAPGGFRSLVPFDDVLWRRPGRLKVLETSHAQMLPRERLYLYSTVFALAPERCLEIGVSQGGSSQIIHAALPALG